MLRATLFGRVGKDPDMRHTQSGKAVTTFSVAVDQGYGDKKTTAWWNVVVWQAQAEFAAKHCLKGRQVCIAGKLTQRKFQREDGTNGQTIELVADEVQIVFPPHEEAPREQQQQQPVGEQDDLMDVPF